MCLLSKCFYLVEADGVGSLTEATSADVETILADESVAVTADTAIKKGGKEVGDYKKKKM